MRAPGRSLSTRLEGMVIRVKMTASPSCIARAAAARTSSHRVPKAWLRQALCGVTLAACGASFVACDEQVPSDEPMGLVVTPLTGTSCGNPDAPNPGPDPFADAPRVTVGVRVFDEAKKEWETIKSSSRTIRAGQAVKLSRVPAGPDREVIVFAQGASQQWYGRDTGVDVVRNADNSAAMVLTRMGGMSCAPTPQGIVNTVFPAAVTLGDGRVLVTGGFTQVADGKLTGASSQAFLFDPRTGLSEPLGSIGVGRAGHAAVYLEATNKVVLIGGMTELSIDTGTLFPYTFDSADGLDDYVLFDVATKAFTPGTERMVAKRGFPRTALMSDGTVLITGGGEWPIDPDGTDQIEADFFDPEANDLRGGLQDMAAPLRSFYWRAGHSMTFIGNSDEGLSSYLIWGGTTPNRSLGHPAEVYRQSGRQRDGVNGTFAEVIITGEVPPFSYFHETTRLADGRFLATGGARTNGSVLEAPVAEEAWLLTYNAVPQPVLQTVQVPGFGPGRVFHTALTSDGVTVSVIGGWSPLNPAETVVKSFDALARAWRNEDGANAGTTGRGGHAAVLTPSGAILLVGGEASGSTAPTARMAAEIYTPATLPLP